MKKIILIIAISFMVLLGGCDHSVNPSGADAPDDGAQDTSSIFGCGC